MMTRLIYLVFLPVAIIFTTIACEQDQDPGQLPDDLAPVGATLLDGLGDYSMPVTSSVPEVQQWFDQGLMLTYGFNHEAAERSFLKAARLDPECAMCWWGASLVLGPNINAAMDPATNATAFDRVQRAQALAENASEREQAYINALSARYTGQVSEDRTSLDQAFADAMKQVAENYPDDLDAATFYAEALMTLQPWEYWDENGRPLGNSETIVSVLESVMQRNPDHAGAMHLYVHAVEASDDPHRGVRAADKLRELIPGSGHLVHMPAHIYARVGRWHDAVIANELAIRADDEYLAICRPGPGVYPLGYVPHNHHFLWFAATMIGDSETALAAARSTAERTNIPELMGLPGLDPMQDFSMTETFANIRFGRWDAIVNTPKPDGQWQYMEAIWHYGQSMAALRQNRLENAREHYRRVVEASINPEIEALTKWGRYSMINAIIIAERILAAELALTDGDFESAIATLQEAVPVEDAMPYDEPPGWHLPVRQILGGVLLESGKAREAQTVYEAELRRNPENIWSLYGLNQALQAQGKHSEARQVAGRYSNVSAFADVELERSYY
jgi:tetratricopeptide (TPR) repeat protein